MKYKIVAYLKQPLLYIDKPKISYQLKKRFWIFWFVINESDNKQELQKQADELNLLINR